MKAKELKKILTIEDIDKIMRILRADSLISSDRDKEICYKTICHCGDSHKLYFYKETKQFHCYTNCGQMDIINIVEKVRNVNITQAISFICQQLNISNDTMQIGFSDKIISDDWDYINEIFGEGSEAITIDEIRDLDIKLLEKFNKMYHPSFYEDGISIKAMAKFGIRYDILNQRIIIPHFDKNGCLIAIRCRNLKKEIVDSGNKYMPIVIDGKLLSAPTGQYFYGLNFNIDNIKKAKKVILLESEKSIMQLETILKGNNIGLALMSSSLSIVQVEMLKELGVEEVVIALDKEFEEYGTQEERNYAFKVRKSIVDKLKTYFSVSILWDKTNLLELKDSPTDKGRETFFYLYENRIRVN